MLSDGEFNIGQTYEALLSIAHLQLNNITLLIDFNHWQALGRSEEVLNLGSLATKLTNFGWQAIFIERGNDFPAVAQVLAKHYRPSPMAGQPTAIILNTVKGFSLPDLADTLDAHYQAATAQLQQAWLAQQGLSYGPRSLPGEAE
jgi:transketolase